MVLDDIALVTHAARAVEASLAKNGLVSPGYFLAKGDTVVDANGLYDVLGERMIDTDVVADLVASRINLHPADAAVLIYEVNGKAGPESRKDQVLEEIRRKQEEHGMDWSGDGFRHYLFVQVHRPDAIVCFAGEYDPDDDSTWGRIVLAPLTTTVVGGVPNVFERAGRLKLSN